ncbi:hypothetical protein OAF65_10945 [Verrucomicrobiales bacterium]|jgi:hypothetical protein|nr:hypothetical protein [Verrucomicrobiales bacterium]
MKLEFEEWGIGSPSEQLLREAEAEYGDALGQCPKSGRGVHKWILKVTMLVVNAEIGYQDAYKQILHAMRDCGRAEQHNEIKAAYEGAKDGGLIAHSTKAVKWHPYDESKAASLMDDMEVVLKKIGATMPDRPELFSNECSDLIFKIRKGHFGTKAIIQTLYPDDDPLLCLGESMSKFTTQHLNEYVNLQPYQLIVPNPMSKKMGVKAAYAGMPEDELTKDSYSAHTKDNTGPRRYLVFESDVLSIRGQCRAISYLRAFLPLAIVVFSGNKSLHAWFSVKDQDPEYVQDFFNLAHCMGADEAMWNEWQFARMPSAWRNDHKTTGVQQLVHFLASPDDQKTCPFMEGIDYPMPILRQD